MIEDVSDHRRILDEADDPHGPLTFRADQGIYFVYLLNQPGPTFPESLFVSLRFEDAGDGIIIAIGDIPYSWYECWRSLPKHDRDLSRKSPKVPKRFPMHQPILHLMNVSKSITIN